MLLLLLLLYRVRAATLTWTHTTCYTFKYARVTLYEPTEDYATWYYPTADDPTGDRRLLHRRLKHKVTQGGCLTEISYSGLCYRMLVYREHHPT